MTLDSILVCATSEYELKRLLKEGGEVWQHVGQRNAGKLRWQHTLVKVPIAVAERLGLVAVGPKIKATPAASVPLPSPPKVVPQPKAPSPPRAVPQPKSPSLTRTMAQPQLPFPTEAVPPAKRPARASQPPRKPARAAKPAIAG